VYDLGGESLPLFFNGGYLSVLELLKYFISLFTLDQLMSPSSELPKLAHYFF